MDWWKIGSAILIVMMMFMIWPAVKAWGKNSPKGSSADWMAAALPIAAVIGFVVLLVMLVR